MFGLSEDGDQISCLLGICTKLALVCVGCRSMSLTVCCEECDGSTRSTCSSCSTNSVNIVLRIVRVIIVENMSNVLDILNELLVIPLRCLQEFLKPGVIM